MINEESTKQAVPIDSDTAIPSTWVNFGKGEPAACQANRSLDSGPTPDHQYDPFFIPQHDPGAKFDGGKVRVGLMLKDFSNALTEVARVTTYGATKYSDSGWKNVPRGVSRYTDALGRHLLAENTEGVCDTESGLMHAAQVAWNALARLELMLRAKTGAEQMNPIK